MQKTKLKVKDKEGNLTTYAVYLDSRKRIEKKIKALPKGVTNRKQITWREFSKIIRLYWKYTFERLLERGEAKLRQNFGTLRIAKTLCVNFNPKRLYPVYDENGEKIGTEYRSVDINKHGGYFFFIWFDSNRYKRYKIYPVFKYKQAVMEKVDDGEDYLDITR